MNECVCMLYQFMIKWAIYVINRRGEVNWASNHPTYALYFNVFALARMLSLSRSPALLVLLFVVVFCLSRLLFPSLFLYHFESNTNDTFFHHQFINMPEQMKWNIWMHEWESRAEAEKNNIRHRRQTAWKNAHGKLRKRVRARAAHTKHIELKRKHTLEMKW